MSPALPLEQLALFWLACLVAYALKGFSGFGSALVFIPVTALVFDPRTALAASPCGGCPTGCAGSSRCRNAI